ncbi:MAG: enterochelin esterase-like enzyme [Verrucomicrobiales bacterium]|jgi:enterochelin esterase-like enzyme
MNQISALILWLAAAGFSSAQWVKPPSAEAVKATPGLKHFVFESQVMKTEVGYNVVFPPSYESAPDKRYPVVYWLHGGGGNESSSLFTAQAWLGLYANQEIDEVILVYPAGFRSGYMDHEEGNVQVESMIIRELIPRIDKTLRTIASREGRAVHGFSMGASGSLKFVIKYPDLFCAAAAGGGGAIDLENTTDEWILNILDRNLGSNPKLVQHNTYHFLEKNHEQLLALGTRFLLLCGDADKWMESAVTFQSALEEKKIPCELVPVPGIAHSLRKVFEAEGARSARFQNEVFREAKARSSSAPKPDPDRTSN